MGRWTARLETQESSDNQPRKPIEPLEQKAPEGFLGSIGRALGHLSESANKKQSEMTKPLLPAPVEEYPELTRQLLEAAMRACDFWGDGQVAKAEMFADVKATPHHLRKDLLEHFLSTYVDADTHLDKSAPAATSFTVLLQRCDGFKPAINFAKL